MPSTQLGGHSLGLAGLPLIAPESVSLVMTAADMRAACRSEWVRRPIWAGSAQFGLGWTDVGSPVGMWWVEESDTDQGTEGAVVTPLPNTQPDGASKSTLYTVPNTSAAFLCFAYLPSSGGVGAVFTNSTRAAGTRPTLTWGTALATAGKKIIYEDAFTATTALVPQFDAHSDREYTLEGCITAGAFGTCAHVLVNGSVTGCKTRWVTDAWAIYMSGNPYSGLLLAEAMVGNDPISMRGVLRAWDGLASPWEFSNSRADGVAPPLLRQSSAGSSVQPTTLAVVGTDVLTGYIRVCEETRG